MKISPDQNTITLDDGTVLVATDASQYPFMDGCLSSCALCELRPLTSLCDKAPCVCDDRDDCRDVIFTKEQKND